MGRRVEKNVDGVVTRYLYSNEGLIGEYDINNNLKKSYGWMPNGIWGTAPLYMTENSQTYYYHNDALGTPHKMTDASGTVVWSAAYTAFGEATVDASSTITSNLRFAGQYFDSETGVNYNLFRFYDPKTGTYISKDPIGFNAGDTNLYRYVKNNPVNWIDPKGLDGFYCGKTPDGHLDCRYVKPADMDLDLGCFIGCLVRGGAEAAAEEMAKEVVEEMGKRATTKCAKKIIGKVIPFWNVYDTASDVYTVGKCFYKCTNTDAKKNTD